MPLRLVDGTTDTSKLNWQLFSSGAVPVSTLRKCTFWYEQTADGPVPPRGGFERFKKFDSQSRGFFSFFFLLPDFVVCRWSSVRAMTTNNPDEWLPGRGACCEPKTTKGIRNPKRSETRTEGGRWSELFVLFLFFLLRVWLFFFFLFLFNFHFSV